MRGQGQFLRGSTNPVDVPVPVPSPLPSATPHASYFWGAAGNERNKRPDLIEYLAGVWPCLELLQLAACTQPRSTNPFHGFSLFGVDH